MSAPFIPGSPGFSITPTRIAFGTILTGLIPPASRDGLPLLYNGVAGSGGRPNWVDQTLFTHLKQLQYTCSTTAHTVTVMRPLNWTTFSAAVAINTTAITLTDDPGAYATTFRYPLPGGAIGMPGGTGVPSLANNTIAANDFVAYQLADGTWRLDTIASGTQAGANLVLTTGTPNVAGATIAAGSPLFFFGIVGDTHPLTSIPHLNFLVIASTSKVNQLGGYGGTTGAGGGGMAGEGIVSLNPGDPMVVHSNNATATGVLDLAAGHYERY